jgi:hypothetical protein
MPNGRAATARRTARQLTWTDWRTLAEATAWLALARAAILLVRFPTMARRLGTHMRDSTHVDQLAHQATLRRTRWAIGAASRRAPWRCMCLEQAIAAKLMLRRHGVPSTLYLGVARARDPDQPSIEAHAWLRCGSLYVTGGENRTRYTVVSTFADGPVE